MTNQELIKNQLFTNLNNRNENSPSFALFDGLLNRWYNLTQSRSEIAVQGYFYENEPDKYHSVTDIINFIINLELETSNLLIVDMYQPKIIIEDITHKLMNNISNGINERLRKAEIEANEERQKALKSQNQKVRFKEALNSWIGKMHSNYANGSGFQEIYSQKPKLSDYNVDKKDFESDNTVYNNILKYGIE